MISTYRRVLAVPGAWAFSLSGLVARLPISMASLGIVLLVSTSTGSYALAGAVSASYLLAGAALAVPQARLVDTYGQRRVLPWTVALFAVGTTSMMWAVEAGWPTPAPQLCAAVAGAGFPQIGSSVRARWSHVVPDRKLLHTAFALEAVVDETVFIVGPTLVTVLATVVHPVAGLASAVLAAAVGTAALVSQRATEPPTRHTVPGGAALRARRAPMGWPVLGPMAVSAVALGVLFGGSEVSVVAFSDALGAKAAAGPLLGSLAVGSLLAGAVTGARSVRSAPSTRYRWGLLVLGLLMLPLPFVTRFPTMGVFLFLSGLAVAPTLIASVAWVEATVPAGRLTEGIAVVTTGLAAGVAPGAALAGVVVDAHGASASFWVSAAGGLGAAAVAAVAGAVARVSRRGPSPSGSSG